MCKIHAKYAAVSPEEILRLVHQAIENVRWIREVRVRYLLVIRDKGATEKLKGVKY